MGCVTAERCGPGLLVRLDSRGRQSLPGPWWVQLWVGQGVRPSELWSPHFYGVQPAFLAAAWASAVG